MGLGETRKIKALLNGVPLNASLQGELVPLFFIPVEQVKRIEVIRGPGSALYGKWAFLGTINVVTRQDGNRDFIRFGSYDAHYGGLLTSYADEDKALKASLNIAGWERGVTDIVSGPDSYTKLGVSNAPGPVNDSRQSPTGVATLKYKWLTVIGQSTETVFGSYHGFAGALPHFDHRRNQKEQIQTIEARVEPEPCSSLAFEINLGVRNYLWDSGLLWLYPAGGIIPDAAFGRSHYEEQALYSNFNFHFDYFEKHKILLGLELETVAMQDVWVETNFDPISLEPVSFQRFTGDKNFIKEGQERDIFGVFMQDQINVAENISLTTGLRYDFYDDIENKYDRISPRIAGVYRPTNHHVFKAQYAEAFRPPSFQEIYGRNFASPGNPKVEEETVGTYELGYIHKRESFSSVITLFYSELKELISNLNNTIPVNKGRAAAKGAEVEFDWEISKLITLDANLSYVKTDDKQTGQELAGGANWLGNAAVIYRFKPDYFFTTTYRFVGKRIRLEDDPRSDLKGYHRFGIVIGVENLVTKGLKLHVGVNNIFDEDIRNLSSYFIEDYKTTGRESWIKLSFSF